MSPFSLLYDIQCAVPKTEFRHLELGSFTLKLHSVVSLTMVLQSPTTKASNHSAVSNLTQLPGAPGSAHERSYCSIVQSRMEEIVSAVGVDVICCEYQIMIEVAHLRV